MVSLETSVALEGGVSLVSLELRGGPAARTVRVENRLAGPVWPPRSAGVPLPGYDEGGFETRVPSRERVLAGYACPAEPAEPPAELVESLPPTEDGPGAVRRALRLCGPARPPREGGRTGRPADGGPAGRDRA